MHDAVANGVRDGGVTDSLVPLGNGKLGAEDRGSAAVAVFQDFKQNQSAGCVEDLKPEIVNDEESLLGYLGQLPKVGAVCLTELHLFEEFPRGPVAHAVAVNARLLAQHRRR